MNSGGPTDEQLDVLIDHARSARAASYAPYSGFLVGAAVLAGGRTFVGVNVENASYPMSMCAERNAIAAAIAAEERVIDAIAVVGGSAEPAPPCGGCRQVLWEVGSQAIVVSELPEGARRRWTIQELLPDAFDRTALGER